MSTPVLSLLDAADEWPVERAERFDPFGWDSPDEKDRARTAFTELSVYVYLSEKYNRETTKEIKRIVKGNASDNNYINLLDRYPEKALTYAGPVAVISSLGWAGQSSTDRLSECLTDPVLVTENEHRCVN